MKELIFKGIGTAIATPFDEHNNINYGEFKRLIEFQIKNGVQSIIVCGTTGESATLNEFERCSLIEFCVKQVNGRIPVIAGVGSNSTVDVIKNIKYAESVNVDGLLIVTPYYNKTTGQGLIQHYELIASETKLPIILYNVPSRTGVDITPEIYLELSKVKNIVATKEASGNVSKIARIRSLCGDNLNIYSGNDDQILPILSLGGAGAISVLSNIIPKYTFDMVDNFWKNNIEKAIQMQVESIPIINSLFKEVNPIPVKAALELMGYKFGKPRLPLVECTDNLKKELRQEIIKLENKL